MQILNHIPKNYVNYNKSCDKFKVPLKFKVNF